MNGIDDEFIEEALTYERSKKRKPSCVLRIVLVAALISVLLFTSALAFSPSLRENTLNVLVEIFSDHATFCVEGDEPAGSYIAGKIDYGDQYYNSNIPDEYTLTSRTDDRIDFTVTAHYSYPYPRQDETEAERDERLETSYEYTRTYPVTLIYTDAGWRFDAFTTPNQADMQLIGEWDGVEETDFYLPNN